MTKQREPVTIENALLLVLGELTIERAADATTRQHAYLRAAADPDNRQELTVRDLVALDLAHDALHGRGFPLFEAIGRQMACSRAERFADAASIGAAALTLHREVGDASAAMLDLALDGSDDLKKLDAALREAEEADRAAGEAVETLRAAKARRSQPRAPP